MSIEPLSSVMSLQQQTYSPAKPVQPVNSAEISQQPDTAAAPLEDIAVVGSATEKGSADNSENKNHITIKIVDKETKKVIKELPPEKTLDMIAKVWEMAGLFVNEKR